MTRLIDTMTEKEVHERLSPFFDCQLLFRGTAKLLTADLEALFEPVQHWSDSLDPEDDQTWVMCFVWMRQPERRYAEWISEVLDYGYRGPEGLAWTYATPVDLNLRYNNGEDTL